MVWDNIMSLYNNYYVLYGKVIWIQSVLQYMSLYMYMYMYMSVNSVTIMEPLY